VGSIPVFQQDGKIYGRIGFNAAPLFRGSNPSLSDMVAGGRYELYSAYLLRCRPFQPVSLRRKETLCHGLHEDAPVGGAAVGLLVLQAAQFCLDLLDRW
jgi:hypothetical protein